MMTATNKVIVITLKMLTKMSINLKVMNILDEGSLGTA